MDDCKTPVQSRKKADFRGTVSFASLNAHNSIVSFFYAKIDPRTYLGVTTYGVCTLSF